jgi:hypothetical protein
MSNAATAQGNPNTFEQTNCTSRLGCLAAKSFNQHAAGSVRRVAVGAMAATLAVAGFAAASQPAALDAIGATPTCSETCAPVKTTISPRDGATMLAHLAGHGPVSERSLERRVAPWRSHERLRGLEPLRRAPTRELTAQERRTT